MPSRSVVAIAAPLALLVPLAARAEDGVSPDPSRPGLANEAAAVPERGVVRAAARGGGSATGGGEGDATVTWSFLDRVAASAGAHGFDGLITPSVGVSAQALAQRSAGVDLTTSLRYRSLGMELAGSELDARVAVGRAFGPLLLVANGMLGRGIGVRTDVDWEGGVLATVRATKILRVGAEARARGELVDDFVTAEDEGRPVDLLTGAVAGVAFDRMFVQALGGWRWPRGPLRSGPAALAAAGFEF